MSPSVLTMSTEVTFFFSSVVSTWNLWGKVLPNDCLDGQKEIRRIKVSSQEFFFPPKSSLFLYNRISHFYQPLFSKPWWEQPISLLFQRNTFLLDFTSAGSCSSCGFSSSITASSGCCRILIMRLSFYIGHQKDRNQIRGSNLKGNVKIQ